MKKLLKLLGFHSCEICGCFYDPRISLALRWCGRCKEAGKKIDFQELAREKDIAWASRNLEIIRKMRKEEEEKNEEKNREQQKAFFADASQLHRI